MCCDRSSARPPARPPARPYSIVLRQFVPISLYVIVDIVNLLQAQPLPLAQPSAHSTPSLRNSTAHATQCSAGAVVEGLDGVGVGVYVCLCMACRGLIPAQP